MICAPATDAVSTLILQVVGVTSHGIEPDSEDPQARLAGAKALRLELEWASHMSLQACILPLPQLLCNAHLACILNQVSISQWRTACSLSGDITLSCPCPEVRA